MTSRDPGAAAAVTSAGRGLPWCGEPPWWFCSGAAALTAGGGSYKRQSRVSKAAESCSSTEYPFTPFENHLRPPPRELLSALCLFLARDKLQEFCQKLKARLSFVHMHAGVKGLQRARSRFIAIAEINAQIQMISESGLDEEEQLNSLLSTSGELIVTLCLKGVAAMKSSKLNGLDEDFSDLITKKTLQNRIERSL